MEAAAQSHPRQGFIKRYIRPPLMRSALKVFSWLPLPLNHRLGSMIGRLSYRIRNDVQHVARVNIRHCLPALMPEQQEQLVKEYLIETGKTLTETGMMWMRNERDILARVKEVSGGEHLQEAVAAGKGVILAAPHMGSWEIIGHYCSSHYPMTCMYRPQKSEVLDQIVRNGRTRFGMKLAPTDGRGIKQLITALRSGELVGILPDQVPQPGQGVFSDFFGIPAYSITLLSRLTQKTGARVLYTYAERLPRGEGYHLHFLLPPEDIYHAELERSVAAMNRGIEECIHRCVSQYQWGYRRFKIRPEGEAEFY